MPAIDLMRFCDWKHDIWRYDISKPFRLGDFTYATNSRLLIEVPASEYPSEAREKTPKADTVLERFPDAGWQPWPAVETTEEMDDCPTCDGFGRMETTECEKCKGTGQVPDSICGELPCRGGCFGTGRAGGKKCETCHGDQEILGPFRQRVGHNVIHTKFDAIIRPLSNVEYCTALVANKDTIFFRFDGGRGAVMPITRD